MEPRGFYPVQEVREMAEQTTTAEAMASKLQNSTVEDATEEAPEQEEVETPDESEETTVTEETDAEESEESEEDGDEDTLPDNVKEILRKNRKELREANARAKAAEKALAEKDSDKESEAPTDDKFKKLFVNTAAKNALVEAGLTNGTERFLKMLDLDNVEVSEDGELSGLEDQIEDLKEEFKDLLAPKAPKKPTAKADTAGRRETPVVPKTSAQLIAERLKR